MHIIEAPRTIGPALPNQPGAFLVGMYDELRPARYLGHLIVGCLANGEYELNDVAPIITHVRTHADSLALPLSKEQFDYLGAALDDTEVAEEILSDLQQHRRLYGNNSEAGQRLSARIDELTPFANTPVSPVTADGLNAYATLNGPFHVTTDYISESDESTARHAQEQGITHLGWQHDISWSSGTPQIHSERVNEVYGIVRDEAFQPIYVAVDGLLVPYSPLIMTE